MGYRTMGAKKGVIMDDLMERALSSTIHKQFESWRGQGDAVNEIEKALFQDCTHDDNKEMVYAKMIINSMEVAAFISTKIIMEMLITGGVIRPADKKKLMKECMSVVKEKDSGGNK